MILSFSMDKGQSAYAKSLSVGDRQNYYDKLKYQAKQLPDPLTLDDWHQDMTLLPNVTWWDITNYLINTPSPFTKEAIRNYKSTEAYSYFIAGHVQDVFMSTFVDEFAFFKTQVIFIII